ncbi:hypothetical protein G7Y79_00001g000360 [Physcia stellaris]|nr:hypothetical protein G7Y79_00001g000360 [Physcia stellaris]
MKLMLQSQDLWKQIEPSVGLLKYLIDLFELVPEVYQGSFGTEGKESRAAKLDSFRKQLEEKEAEVHSRLASVQKDIEQIDKDILAARDTQAEGSSERPSQSDTKRQTLETKKKLKHIEHQQLSKSTEKCVKQELRYKRKDLLTGAIPDPEIDYSISEVLNQRPYVSELRIQSLESHPNNYLTWAVQVRMYLLARGVLYVLEESDEENLPGIYDSLNTTLRDRDDALARFIISTALTRLQCVHVYDKSTAKQYWTAVKFWYGPMRDDTVEKYVTPTQLMAKMDEDVKLNEDGNDGKVKRRRGKGRRRGRS